MIKTSCFKSGHFINIYLMNRTLHDRLRIRILSSSVESISHSFASLTRERYFQHSKIKFVSPRGHVISSIYYLGNQNAHPTSVSMLGVHVTRDTCQETVVQGFLV